MTDMTEAAPITKGFFAITPDAIYSPDAHRRDVAQLGDTLLMQIAEKFKGPCLLTDTEMALADRHAAQGDLQKLYQIFEALHLAEHAAVERAAVEQAALTGQWKVRQDTEMLCAALAKAREQLASAEGVALRLAEAAGV